MSPNNYRTNVRDAVLIITDYKKFLKKLKYNLVQSLLDRNIVVVGLRVEKEPDGKRIKCRHKNVIFKNNGDKHVNTLTDLREMMDGTGAKICSGPGKL